MADEQEACSAGTFDSAFTKAFLKTDEEFGKADNAALVGTTAVVALVGDRQLYIGNCGAHFHLVQPERPSMHSPQQLLHREHRQSSNRCFHVRNEAGSVPSRACLSLPRLQYQQPTLVL